MELHPALKLPLPLQPDNLRGQRGLLLPFRDLKLDLNI